MANIFADDIFKYIFIIEKFCISMLILLTIVRKVRIKNNPALVEIMAWPWVGDKPLSQQMKVSLCIHASLGFNELTN